MAKKRDPIDDMIDAHFWMSGGLRNAAPSPMSAAGTSSMDELKSVVLWIQEQTNGPAALGITSPGLLVKSGPDGLRHSAHDWLR
jgi:hypothetical protein